MLNGQLMITGLGAAGHDEYFVELFTKERVPALDKYGINTEIEWVLPKLNVSAKTFILITSKYFKVETFLKSNSDHSLGYSGNNLIKMKRGNDPVVIYESETNFEIDRFGSEKCGRACSYDFGWAKRKDCSDATPIFNQSEWIISVNAFRASPPKIFTGKSFSEICGKFLSYLH